MFTDPEARHPDVPEIALVLDNARYDRSRELRARLDRPGGRIRLVHLPSYAPNLDLIERFRHVMKRKVPFDGAYAKFALFRHAFDDVFGRLHEHQTALESLVTDRFHLIGRPEAGISSASGYITGTSDLYRPGPSAGITDAGSSTGSGNHGTRA